MLFSLATSRSERKEDKKRSKNLEFNGRLIQIQT